MRCPGPPCSVKKYRGSRCNIEEIKNVPKKLLEAAVAIEEPKRFPYPPIPWPYPSREFRAWLIPAPAAERRNREGATLSPAKSSNFCLRSEEHTSELQSPCNLVCRLLLEKKKKLGSEHLQLINRKRHSHQ